MSAPPPELVSASPAGSTAFAEPKPLQGSHARFGVADGGSARSFTSSNGTDGDQPSPGSGSTFDGTNDAVKERARRAITGLSNSSAKIKDLLPGRRGKDRKRGKESFVGEDGGPTADSSQQRSFSLSSAFSATTDAHGRRRTESEASIDGENTLHPTLSQHADLMEASDVE